MENTQRKIEITKRMGVQKEKIVAALLLYIFDQMAKCREILAHDKPKCNEREFKLFSRILKDYIDDSNRNRTYKMTQEHRDEVDRLKGEFIGRTDYNMQMLYFSVRNEVINSGLDESTWNACCHMRMMDITIDALSSVLIPLGFDLREHFKRLSDVLKAFCCEWEDKGGHQKLVEQILIKEVNLMMLCE